MRSIVILNLMYRINYRYKNIKLVDLWVLMDKFISLITNYKKYATINNVVYRFFITEIKL